MIHTPEILSVLIDAIALVARLTGMKQRLGKYRPRKFAQALEIVLKDFAGEAVSPPSQENNSCVV